MRDKLKPLDCMRCGGSLELHTIQTGMSTMGSYVKCSKCELQGKTFNEYHGNHMKLATEFWNTRAADSINQALIDALKAVDELWEGDKGFNEEKEACEGLEWDSPVYVVWKKARAALALAGGESE